MHEVQLTTTRQRPTAVVAARTTWAEFPSLWGRLLDQVYVVVRAGGVTQTGHNVMLYKDDVPNVEVGVEVGGPFPPAGDVVPSVLPAGEAAMTLHRGSYAGLGDAHRSIHEWCATSGRTVTGVRWEVYGDWHEDESLIETEVYYLLAPRS